MNSRLSYDVVVIGAGTAGLVAATRLAQSGASVCVSPGDRLHTPGAGNDRRARLRPGSGRASGKALAELIVARPDHPYGLIGTEVSRSHRFSTTACRRRPATRARLCRRTAARHGSRPRSAAATLGGGAGDDGRRRLPGAEPRLRRRHAGTARLPSQLCAQSRAAGIEARPVSVDLELERADMDTLGVARHLETSAGERSSVPRSHRCCAPTSTSAYRRCSDCEIPTRSDQTSSTASAAACLRSRRCRHRCRG